jgi:hypothetical protein
LEISSIYTQQIASAAGDIAQGNPEVESALLNLLGSCTTPLLHRGQVEIITGPDNQPPRIYLDEFTDNQYQENPWFSTLNVSNPLSVFVTNEEGDEPVYIDGGITNWNNGVTWSSYLVSYWAYFNRVNIRNLKIENLKHDGYKFEDRRVLEDVTVSFSFDPESCEGTATVTKSYVNIKTLVRDDDAGNNSPTTDDSGEDDSPDDSANSGSQNSPADSSVAPATETTTQPIDFSGIADRMYNREYPAPNDAIKFNDIITKDIWERMQADDQNERE